MANDVLYPEDIGDGDVAEAINSLAFRVGALYGVDSWEVEEALKDLIDEFKEYRREGGDNV